MNDFIIDYNSAIPLYKQIYNSIKNKICSGELKPGDKIETEYELSVKYSVSRITIRNAVMELVEEGFLQRIQGKGTFVSDSKNVYDANDSIGFTRSCLIAGKKATSKLISSGFTYPNEEDMIFFNIEKKDQIIFTKRLRLVDNIPAMIETNHYSIYFSFLLKENLEGSLFEILKNKYNIFVKNKVRSLETAFPNKEEIELLNIKKNTPLLLFKDEQLDQNGNNIFISRQVYCSENVKFYL